MGRGVSSGGGQSSLGYLFGSGGENPAQRKNPINGVVAAAAAAPPPPSPSPPPPSPKPQKPAVDPQIPAGIHGNLTNNYYRADGQNCGNFITDRPSTKVHAAPGGGSSLGYLFGGNGN